MFGVLFVFFLPQIKETKRADSLPEDKIVGQFFHSIFQPSYTDCFEGKIKN